MANWSCDLQFENLIGTPGTPKNTPLRYTVSWRCIRLWATQYTRTQCRPVEVTCNTQTTFHLHHELHVCYRFLSHLSHPSHVRPWALHIRHHFYIYLSIYIYIYIHVYVYIMWSVHRMAPHKAVGTVSTRMLELWKSNATLGVVCVCFCN